MRIFAASIALAITGLVVVAQPVDKARRVPTRQVQPRPDRAIRIPPAYDYEGEHHALLHLAQIRKAERERAAAHTHPEADPGEVRAPTPAPQPRAQRAAPPSVATGSDWPRIAACIRQIESTDNYRAVNPSGKYRGAYQMDTSFWVTYGGDPAYAGRHEQAPPAEQDAVARRGWQARGLQPWPTPSKRC